MTDREFVIEYWTWNHMANTLASERDILRYYRKDWNMSEGRAWAFMREAIVADDLIFRNYWSQVAPKKAA